MSEGATPLHVDPPIHRGGVRTALGNVAQGSTLNLLGAGASAVSNFALVVVVTRGYSTADAGVFLSATALFLLATNLGQLGTSTGLVYFLSQARAHGNLRQASAYMRTAVLPVMATAACMSGALLMFARPIAEVASPGHVELFESYLRALAVFIPAAGIGNLCYSGTRGLGTMKVSALLDQTIRPLVQVLLVGLALLVPWAHLAAVAWAFPYLPIAFVAWFAFRATAKREGGHVAGRHSVSRLEFWRFSAPRALASVAQVAMQRLDVILVGAMAGVAQAAIYAAVSRFLSLGQMGAGAISQAVQPHLGEALASRDAYKTAHLYQTSTSWLVLVTWPLYLVLIIFAHPILKVFGGVYSQGNSVLIVLCLSMLVATSCGMVDMVLMMAGRTSWNLYNVLLAFAVNLGLDLWLIPRHGIFGAAVGWGVAILVANLVPLIQVAWSLGLHPFGPGTAAALSICVVCFGFVPFGCKLLAGAGPVGLLTSLALGAACFLGGLYRFRGRLELASLRALRRSRRTRSA